MEPVSEPISELISRIIAPLLCGLIFGTGLLVSGMVQPTKVLGFLDILGAWDPSLAVVMAAALAVATPGFMLARQHAQPLLAGQYFWPGKSGIDAPLVLGAGLFRRHRDRRCSHRRAVYRSRPEGRQR